MTIKQTRKQYFYRIYGTWYDTFITAFFLLILVGLFLYISVSLIYFDPIPFMKFPSQLSAQKSFEFGIGVLGVTLSVGSVAALTVAKTGTERKVNIRRSFGFHKHILNTLAGIQSNETRLDDQAIRDIMTAYRYASLVNSHQILDCSPEAHKAFEELRFDAINALESSTFPEEGVRNWMEQLIKFCVVCFGVLETDLVSEDILKSVAESQGFKVEV